MAGETTESKVNESLQKTLTKDLGKLQDRLEKYEDALMAPNVPANDKSFLQDQVKYYREEVRKVRESVLAMQAAAMAELKR